MESRRRRVKRKIKNPKTLLHTIKKRLRSDYGKAKLFLLILVLLVIAVGGYFFLTMPMPQATNSNAGFEEANRELDGVKRQHQKKRQ